jgi:hypothetical protein
LYQTGIVSLLGFSMLLGKLTLSGEHLGTSSLALCRDVLSTLLLQQLDAAHLERVGIELDSDTEVGERILLLSVTRSARLGRV